MALWFMGFLGARPFAAGLNGILADAVSARAAMGLTAAIICGVAYPCPPSQLKVDWPRLAVTA